LTLLPFVLLFKPKGRTKGEYGKESGKEREGKETKRQDTFSLLLSDYSQGV